MASPSLIAPQKCPMCASDRTDILCQRTHCDRQWSLAKCQGCGLHFTDPTPTESDMNRFYERDYHDALRDEGATEQVFGPKYQRYADYLGRYLHTGRAVDVGCATGLLVRILCDRGYQAEGVELNSQSAEWGRNNYNVTIHNKLLNECSYEPGSLDVLLFTDVLEHTQHPRDFLRDAARLLVPRGYALITFPDIRSVESRYFYALSKLLRRDWLWSCCHIPLHTWEFTRKTAEACFADAGFRVAGFRRAPSPEESSPSPLSLRLLNLPSRFLNWPPIGRWLGTQMEFIIQKTS